MKKSAVLAVRVTPDFKKLLRLAAQADRRSQSGLLEVLVYEHCKKRGIRASTSMPTASAPRRRSGVR